MKSEIEGEKIKIRKLKLSDAEDIFRNIKDRAVIKWLELDDIENPYSYSKIDALKFIRKSLRKLGNKKCYNFGIALKKNDKVVGGVGLGGNNIDWRNKNAEIWYWLGKRYWGQGITTEVVKLVVKFGFKKLKLHRIYGYASEDNIASQKVFEKSGFKLEGMLKDKFYYDKKWHNGLIYGSVNRK